MLLSRVSMRAIPTACKQISTFRSSLSVSVARHSTMRVLVRKSKHGHEHDLDPADGDASKSTNGGHSDQLVKKDIEPMTLTAIPVLFKYGDHCRYGEAFAVTGSTSELGSWDPKRAVRMKWDHGDVWMAVINLPSGANTEYKFIKVDANTGDLISWMDDASSPGFNHGNLIVEDGRRTVRGHIAEAFLSIPADYAHLTEVAVARDAGSKPVVAVSECGALSEYSDEALSTVEEAALDDPPMPPQHELNPIAQQSPGKGNHAPSGMRKL